MEATYLPSDYEPPALTELGTFEDLTEATNVGERTDIALPYAHALVLSAYS
jgi:hypothetical protein